MVTVDRFLRGLQALSEAEFTLDRVGSYLEQTPVDPESLSPYLLYRTTHYTRNLVYKSDLFELIVLCWEVGQISRIHNHQGQRCWMAVPIGCLAVQNYAVVRADDRGYCELREADRLVMDPRHPSAVAPETPIHAVLNLPEYSQPAASLHVYSRPYDRCLVYSLEKRSCTEVPLFYDSEYGRPTGVTG
jgi:cysteine dioxygenase